MKNLFEELEKYAESDYYPFHTPGHKRFSALGFHKHLTDIYKLDITEIEGFDNLHHPKGLLLELQEKAARVYHAEESFFLINGSTGGILSAVSAVAKEGKKLLIARNCHKSVYNAVLLNRLRTEYLWPENIEEFDIQGKITPAQVEEKIRESIKENAKESIAGKIKEETKESTAENIKEDTKENTRGNIKKGTKEDNNDNKSEGSGNICGIVITSPTYEGVISDIRKIAEIAHHYRIPLIVDEAHGAHFASSERAPESAVECGADIVINSVHKTLPALTQTALLHVQGKLVDREKLKKYLSVYQSSSPSYILMASIDSCMDFMMRDGAEWFERLLKLREKVDKKAADYFHIRIFPLAQDRIRHDPGKLVISVKGTNMTGKELYDVLLEKYHLQMEMAAPTSVLGILTGMDGDEGIDRLLVALREIDETLSWENEDESGAEIKQDLKTKYELQAVWQSVAVQKAEAEQESGVMQEPETAVPICTIYEAEQLDKEWIPLADAAGRISGEFLCLYPPGIPLIVPGERMNGQLLNKIEKFKKEGLNLTGLSEKGEFCFCKEKTVVV